MTCSKCYASTEGKPVAMIYVAVDGEHDLRFTGVVWCAACVPGGHDGEQIHYDMEIVAR